MLGLHTQMTLVAPTLVKMSCTCRHAWTYSPGRLPERLSDHGYQMPFISCAKLITTGHLWSRTPWANLVM
jgi:hypothetical protein